MVYIRRTGRIGIELWLIDIPLPLHGTRSPPQSEARGVLEFRRYIYLIILDADFDEDSGSDLRLEIGAHLDLVFEG